MINFDDIRPCPRCGSELLFDEVDIGVGIQRGNYRCDNCGWNEEDNPVLHSVVQTLKEENQ